MNFVRFKSESKPKVEMKGILDGDTIYRIHGSFFQSYTVTNEKYNLSDIEYLPPVVPGNILCFKDDAHGYSKPVSSLRGSLGTLSASQSGQFVVPMLACIIDPRSADGIFGVSFMLDFSTVQSFGLITPSKNNVTIVGPELDTSRLSFDNIIFAHNNVEYELRIMDNYIKFIREISLLYSLRPGDIVALSLLKDFTVSCHSPASLRIGYCNSSNMLDISL